MRLCQDFEATEYLAGQGSKSYLDVSMFEQAGIKVIFQDPAEMNMMPVLELLTHTEISLVASAETDPSLRISLAKPKPKLEWPSLEYLI